MLWRFSDAFRLFIFQSIIQKNRMIAEIPFPDVDSGVEPDTKQRFCRFRQFSVKSRKLKSDEVYMREKYESLSLATLKELAKARGMKGISALKKSDLIAAMLAQDEKDKNASGDGKKNAEPSGKSADSSSPSEDEGKKNAECSGKSADLSSHVEHDEKNIPSQPGQTPRPEGARGDGAERAKRPNTGARRGEIRRENRENTAGGTRRYNSMRRTENGYSNMRRERPDYTVRRDRNENAEAMDVRRERTESAEGMETRWEFGGVRRERTESTEGMETRREFGGVRRDRTESEESMGTRREFGGSVSRDRSEKVDGAVPFQEYSGARDAGARQERTDYIQMRRDTGVRQEERERAELIGENTEDRPPAELAQLDSGMLVSGILEVMQDGYGFIRSDNYLPGENDVYVSPSQIRKFNLKTGDIIAGNTRIKSQQEKFSALLYLRTINGKAPSEAMKRSNFEDMTPIFPNERLRMERGSRAVAMRIVDLFSPIGKGQRGMIVSPPKAGKTTLLKDIAHSILQNDPDMRLLILLIDERPEEVTDIKEAIQGENVEVIYSTFDELPDHHKRVSEMAIERAKRLVEQKENVTILLDSITRLARAYNLTVPPSGRTLSGGLDPAALHMPKRFFGAARNMREGGSLTILATALVDTGSKMDDVVYEEFKGTGNMELVLDRKLSEKRVFPAVDIPKSGTRREDLLLDREEQEAVYIMRRALNGMKSDEAVENILNMFVHTRDNSELVQRVRRQKFI